MTSVSQFQVDFTRFLDPQGEALAPLPDFAQDPAVLLPLYRAMHLTRIFDSKAIALQRTGKLGTFASALGQEAVGVGVASAMAGEDVLVPSYRDHGAQFLRGVKMEEVLLYWGGDDERQQLRGPRSDFPVCVPIATQVCHAAGAAYAFKLREEARVAVCFLGDGATSKGDFYEGLNFAAAWQAPMVVIINNNQWAISVPRERQTAARTLAQKAIAAGIEGVQVDGNDIVAVRHAAQQALDKARDGGGPAVIEAISYRLGDHTTADDATRYRDAEAVENNGPSSPSCACATTCCGSRPGTPSARSNWSKECTEAVNAAVEAYLATPPPPVTAMFDQLFATLPPAMQAQLDTALRFENKQGGGHG